MGTTNTKVIKNAEEVVDDSKNESELNEDILNALKAKAAKKKEKDMPPKIVSKVKRSLNIGVIGTGQGGSKLAACFYELGYSSVVINTAAQDLEHIKVPESNKLLLDYSLGGAAKELSIGHAAALEFKPEINELVHAHLNESEILLLTTSLGGGSGAGSVEVVIDVLAQLERPVLVMAILPMANEDAQTKQNALETLAKLTKAAQAEQIAGLIVVDNAKIESIYTDVSQLNFYNVANNAIIKTLDVFNRLSSQPSPIKGIDNMELSKILTDGRGLITYGEMKVSNYTDDTAIAEAVIENLNSNLLSGGFDLKQARYVGVMIAAPKAVWDHVPTGSIDYAMAMINENCGSPNGVFKGIYEVESDDDFISVYSIFSGMGLPSDRIEQLKVETKSLKEKSAIKDENRSGLLKIDMGAEETTSAVDKIRQKITAKNSAFGKMMTKGIRDRRK